ncbi:AAA family ATPase [Streptomyces sp. NPDC020875]|uniref:HelD family protein n=1 Tax=Streptomyces sp. NPDC020875 TaxID=3154898 RepID=UPI0034112B84
MAGDAAERVVTGEHAFASGADAEVLGYELRSRARELADDPGGPLFFGRLDFTDGPAAGDHRGQRYYLGRRRITDPGPESGPGTGPGTAPPLVIDWRAPVARTFYQAGPRAAYGVRIRRRYGWAPLATGLSAELTGFEDEYLEGAPAPAATADAADAGQPLGPLSPLVTAELERPRVGPMRDIAATIQPEQDDLVRSGLAETVCVQGAPGTGKTAVGLHRAAFLLYTHPRRLRRGGLLVIGPNRAFLGYIERVLPSLGETGVRQSTLAEEITRHPAAAPAPGGTPDAEDTPAAAVVKHDVRMADVLRRALYARVGGPLPDGPGAGLVVPDGSYRWRIPAETLTRIVAEVRAGEPPYETGRERVRDRAVREIRLAAERRAGPRGTGWVRRIERSRPVGAFLDAVWPRTTPEEVLTAFLADPADPALTPAERAAIRRPAPTPAPAPAPTSASTSASAPARSRTGARRKARPPVWTPADRVLLDELAGLMARPDGYGHVVVDEAQDLSPMECRAVARRTAFGSLTVLGDLAQGTSPWAARSWPEQLALLGRPDAKVTALTTGYRVPGAVLEYANRLLGSLGVDVPPARSARPGGELTVRRVAELTAGVVAAVRDALAREGSVAVIADRRDAARLRTALAAAGLGSGAAGGLGGGSGGGPDEPDRVAVLPADLVKGLEYDHVVVAEPAAIAAAEERGPHRLYVVLTRAVSRLTVVHARPLPRELTD